MAGIKEMLGLNKANFSTVEKDYQEITSRIIGNETILKLLYYNTPDCLKDKSKEINAEIITEITQENLRLIPSLEVPKNKGSFLIVTFDGFAINDNNPEFMNNMILIDVLSPADSWMMDDYMMRPFRIMHELQGLFHNRPLNGIGKVYLEGASLLNIGEYNGYQMVFSVINDA